MYSLKMMLLKENEMPSIEGVPLVQVKAILASRYLNLNIQSPYSLLVSFFELNHESYHRDDDARNHIGHKNPP